MARVLSETKFSIPIVKVNEFYVHCNLKSLSLYSIFSTSITLIKRF